MKNWLKNSDSDESPFVTVRGTGSTKDIIMGFLLASVVWMSFLLFCPKAQQLFDKHDALGPMIIIPPMPQVPSVPNNKKAPLSSFM